MSDKTNTIECEEFHTILREYKKSSPIWSDLAYKAVIAYIDKERASMIAETVEKCAKVAEGGSFLHDDAPDARLGKACAKAIRALSPESIADTSKDKPDEHAAKCVTACAGLPDGALDGGWTAAGMGAYAAKLERALAPFASHPAFQAPDDCAVTHIDASKQVAGVTAGDFRRAKEAMLSACPARSER